MTRLSATTNFNVREAYWYQRAMKAEAELKRLRYRYGTCPQCGGPMDLPLEDGIPCARCDWPEENR